LVVYTLK